jgi:predicted metal-dependent enzyme (double-stranded beta helix superfamily)
VAREDAAMSATILTSTGSEVEQLAAGVRTAIAMRGDWSHTVERVADQLRAHLPSSEVLTSEQRLGSPDRAAGHTLHVEPDGSFSITAVVWRPGQFTRIHDHTTWCVFGVIQGVEHEDIYDTDLNLIGSSDGMVGDVNGFAPPGDIHRVHNTSDEVAISIHIYGTDLTRVGSSVRRYYD